MLIGLSIYQVSGTVNKVDDLCPPAAEIRRPGTVALGLERAGRLQSHILLSSLSQTPWVTLPGLNPLLPQKERATSAPSEEPPKKHLPMCPRPHIQNGPSIIVVVVNI